MLNFKALKSAVDLERSAAYRETKACYAFVSNRGGAMLCTADDRGDQCRPNVAAECPFWDGRKTSIEALVADVLANHPHVEVVYIEGAYDGADSMPELREGSYDPRVAEWSVQVWTRQGGYAQEAQ